MDEIPDELQADPRWVAEVVTAAFQIEAALYHESKHIIEQFRWETATAMANLQHVTRRNR